MPSSIKTCVIIVGLAFGGPLAACAPTATSESTGAYVDDASITTKVKAAIFDDPALKSLEIHIVTYKSVVQLSGFVDSDRMIGRAGEAAAKVAGVRSVQNDLVVR